MSNDLQRFLRAVRTLRLLGKYDLQTHLDALGKHATAKQKEDVTFASALLEPIAQALMRQRFANPEHCCRHCGRDLDYALIPNALVGNASPGMTHLKTGRRADAQYCPDCRQKAYRARVTAKAAKHERKRNGVTARTAKHKPKRNGELRSDTA